LVSRYDTAVTLPLIGRRPAELFHHAAGLAALGGLARAGKAGAHLRHALLCELSTIVMDVIWLLGTVRGDQFRKSRLRLWLSLAFLLSFFATRVVWLPLVVNRMRKTDPELWDQKV
jgi:hypothetical protein